MTKQEAKIIQLRLRHTTSYDEVVKECPSFGRAVDALPDTEPMDYVNVFLRELLEDAIKWATNSLATKRLEKP